MIIDCVADLHGEHPHLEGGDVLIIAGDCTSNDTIPDWKHFFIWLDNQEYAYKIVVGGNHDNFLTQCATADDPIHEILEEIPNFIYLCDSGCEIQGVKFWGSPWTLKFPGINPHCCAFTLNHDIDLIEKWNLIPDDIDVLITHMPAWGIFDITKRGECVGSVRLRNEIMWRIKPEYHICGHIHECGGQIMKTATTTFINASVMNEDYEPVNRPIRIIPLGIKTEYIRKCSLCGLEKKILTQHDDDPEYRTEIFLQCECGNYIFFSLPVN